MQGREPTAVDRVGVLVWDLNAELLYGTTRQHMCCRSKRTGIRPLRASPYLLNSHDHLDGIEAVQSEVVREVCGLGDLRS